MPHKVCPIKQRLSKYLTAKGLKWVDGTGITDREKLTLCDMLEDNRDFHTPDLAFNCGGSVLNTMGHSNLPQILKGLIRIMNGSDGGVRASLIVATWNRSQRDTTELYKSVGFTGLTEWVLNPNSRNKIRGMIGVFDVSMVKYVEPRSTRW